MAGLVPAISIIGTLCPPDRDRRDKPGDDAWAATSLAPLTNSQCPPRHSPLDAAAPWSKISAIKLVRRLQTVGGIGNATRGFGYGVRGCIGVRGFRAGHT